MEGRWVWSVVSYSTENKAINVGLYFPEEDEWVFHTLEVEKKLPLELMKYIVGPSYGVRSIHGEFFDARFEFEYYADEEAIKKFFEEDVNKPNNYRVGGDSTFVLEDGEYIYEVLRSDANFDNSLDSKATLIDLKTKYFDARQYSVKGWFKWTQPEEEADWYNIFRLTTNNFAKDENQDYARIGDRTLALWLNKAGFLHFTTHSYADDWSGPGSSNLTKDEETSNDLFSWIFVYFGYSYVEKKATYHIRFEDHVVSGAFDNVNHFIPYWLGFYLGKDPVYKGFNGKMSMFQLQFGPKAFVTGKWRNIYDPRPPEMVRDLSGLNGNDLVGKYENTKAGDRKPVVYGLDLPPELLEDVNEYQIAFWFRHSQNIPEENANWDEIFKRCHNIFRIRETEEDDSQNLGDKSAHLTLCPKNGELVLRLATYDLATNNVNLFIEEPILFSELEGSWIWFYVGFSKADNKLVAYAKLIREERDIYFEIAAEHKEHTEKIRLDLGWDGYVTPLQGTFFDVDFSWGNDGEFHGSADDIEAFYEKTHNKPAENVWELGEESATRVIVEDFQYDTNSQTENPHFSYNADFDFAQDYAVYGWHKWNILPGKSSWYLIYRLHTNQNPSNAQNLGDRTLSLWIGDNVYHPATYHTADKTLAANPNVVSLFNYDGRDINSWMWSYASYSRKEKSYYFYSWCAGKETKIKLDNIVHFVPGYFGFYIAKDPWHRSFHGKIRSYSLAFGPGAYKTSGFDGLRNAKLDAQKAPRFTTADTMFYAKNNENKNHVTYELAPQDLGSIKEYGISFYFRWSQRNPDFIRDSFEYRNKWHILARVTEGFTDGSMGDRNLAVFLGPHGRQPSLWVGTYDVPSGQWAAPALHMPFDLRDFDGVWNFIYLAYSVEEKKFVFYVKFGLTGATTYREFDATHYDPMGNLRFLLGADGIVPSAPGFYYASNYGANEGIYVTGEANVEKYRKKQLTPPSMEAAYSQVVIADEISFSYSEPDVEPVDLSENAAGALEYSVWGHFKWIHTDAGLGWALLFRLSTTEPAIYNNAHTMGDRDLSVWVNQNNFIHFTTYNFNADAPDNNYYVNVPFDYNADVRGKYFFLYYGYSKVEGKAYYYIRFDNGVVKEGSMPVNHFVPKFAFLRLAKDEWHYAWNGEMKYVQTAFGKGAYRDKNFDELRKLKPKFGADEDAYQGQPEFAAGDKDPIIT